MSCNSFHSPTTKNLLYNVAVVAEWLRRLTRNQIPSGSVGSNPTDCEEHFLPFAGIIVAFYANGSVVPFSRQNRKFPLLKQSCEKSVFVN